MNHIKELTELYDNEIKKAISPLEYAKNCLDNNGAMTKTDVQRELTGSEATSYENIIEAISILKEMLSE